MSDKEARLDEKFRDIEKHRVVVTNLFCNLTTMQVCCVSDAIDEEIIQVCNEDNPSGTTGGWKRVIREGEGKPVNCGAYHDRIHFLVVC